MKRFHALTASALLAFGIASAPALADCALAQSTASQEVALPRFVDSTDGVTPETGLTIANTDIKLTKGGGTTQVNKNSGGATHIATGDYYIVLDATDTDTVGNLHIVIGVSGALPVWVDCVVYENAVYDADFANAATGQRWADVRQFNGSAATASSGRPEVNTTHLAGTSLATLTGSYPALGIIESGTAQGVTATTIQFRSGAAFADDEVIGATCVINTATTGAGQARTITDYVGSTDTATVTTWTTTPSGTITYLCFGTAAQTSSGSVSIAAGGITSASFAASAIDAAAIAADAIGASELAADAIGASEIAANAITDAEVASDVTIASVTGAVGSVTGAVGSVTGNVGGNVVGSVASVTGAVGSVTGSVGGNVTGSVGSIGTGGITANSIATDAFTASKFASDVTTEVTAGIPAAIRDLLVDDQGGGISLGCAIAALTAFASGDISTTSGTTTWRDPSNAEVRISSTVTSAGNRTATITCPTY